MNDANLAASYPDRACHGPVVVEENVRLARETYRLRVRAAEIAARIVPGQFVMLRPAHGDDPLLGRPLALYDTVLDAAGRPVGLDVVYLVVGKMTQLLAAAVPGTRLQIWGPLGNGFAPEPTEQLILVAGGIGQTPMLALAQEALGRRRYGDPGRATGWAQRATLCYGVRSGDFFAGLEDFERAGVELRLSTDDGSRGHAGLVTDLVRPLIEESAGACRIVCCGPEPMLAATAEIARQMAVPCQVSLETPMACGLGICFSCVAKVRDGAGGWDYRRTCIEGPVFNGEDIEF